MLLHRDDREKRRPAVTSAIRKTQSRSRAGTTTGNYRPLKTAPNLRHGWRLELADLAAPYGDALIIFIRAAWRCLRHGGTIGLYDDAVTRNVGIGNPECIVLRRKFPTCKSTTWSAVFADLMAAVCGQFSGNATSLGAVPSTKLPPEKFDPSHDQACGQGRRPRLQRARDSAALSGSVQSAGSRMSESGEGRKRGQ